MIFVDLRIPFKDFQPKIIILELNDPAIIFF